jgi:hypothetical protein
VVPAQHGQWNPESELQLEMVEVLEPMSGEREDHPADERGGREPVSSRTSRNAATALATKAANSGGYDDERADPSANGASTMAGSIASE